MRHVLRHAFAALFLVASTAAAADDAPPPEWSYKGANGPSHWGGLALDYPYLECRFGKLQSPIDIGLAKTAALPPIEFNYGPAPLRIINTGHSIQVNLPPGSFISVGGRRYELVQFHFHHPSETKLGGAHLPLDIAGGAALGLAVDATAGLVLAAVTGNPGAGAGARTASRAVPAASTWPAGR